MSPAEKCRTCPHYSCDPSKGYYKDHCSEGGRDMTLFLDTWEEGEIYGDLNHYRYCPLQPWVSTFTNTPSRQGNGKDILDIFLVGELDVLLWELTLQAQYGPVTCDHNNSCLCKMLIFDTPGGKLGIYLPRVKERYFRRWEPNMAPAQMLTQLLKSQLGRDKLCLAVSRHLFLQGLS